jgi:drug/metabolite transporter superfamily protein YnfA
LQSRRPPVTMSPMNATEFLPIVSVLSLITVEFGGWALLAFLTGQGSLRGEPATLDHRMRFFRAGHAHAGVLIVLSLVYYIYLDRADFSNGFDWFVGLLLVAGTLAQSGGFFIHLAKGAPATPSVGTTVTRVGALLIAVALVILAIGLIQQL